MCLPRCAARSCTIERLYLDQGKQFASRRCTTPACAVLADRSLSCTSIFSSFGLPDCKMPTWALNSTSSGFTTLMLPPVPDAEASGLSLSCRTRRGWHLSPKSQSLSRHASTCHTLGIKIAQKPYIVWSLGPKALIYESLDF